MCWAIKTPIEMLRTCTRDMQYCSDVVLIEEIAMGMSATNKRLHMIESHKLSKQPPTEKTRVPLPPKNSTSKTAYWYESSSTLSIENAKLCKDLSKSNEECLHLRANVKRLADMRDELTKSLAEKASTDATPSFAHSTLQSIPVNTDGKDAMHWYQTCRTMEAQFTVAKAELQSKIEELGDKRKRLGL